MSSCAILEKSGKNVSSRQGWPVNILEKSGKNVSSRQGWPVNTCGGNSQR